MIFFVGSCLSNILINKTVQSGGLRTYRLFGMGAQQLYKRAADVSEIKKRSANATTRLNQKLEQEKQVDRDIKNSTIMDSVYGICEGDKDVYLC